MRKNGFGITLPRYGVRPSLLAACMLVSVSVAACKGDTASSMADYIGIDAAKEAALKAAGLSSAEVDFVAAGLDSKDGTFFYQVIFTGNDVEHEYDIDALTGVVIEESHAPQSGAVAANSGQGGQVRTDRGSGPTDGSQQPTDGSSQQSANGGSQQSAGGGSQQQTGGGSQQQTGGGSQQSADGSSQPASGEAQPTGTGDFRGIDMDTALSIALAHAGLTKEDVRFSNIEADVEDGRRVFDVEFVSLDGTEYDYELSAEDGLITSYDYDAEALFRQNPSADNGMISESQARRVVLDRVPGAREEDVRLKLEEDDGRMEYEGKFIYDNIKYEFKVDAYSGGLIEWEAELVGR